MIVEGMTSVNEAKDIEKTDSVANVGASPCSLPCPYYEKNGIVIYYDDCLRILQALRDAGTGR